MAKKPLEIDAKMFGQDNLARYIANQWHVYNSQRNEKIAQWKELRNYIFATDTTTTSNKSLPWKNSTTLPKLCQIRDNLHSNYISALFPNDDWLKWEAYSPSDATKKKTNAIEAYMANKAREGGFRSEISKLVYDYIDYGNVFATVEFENSVVKNARGEDTIDYIGPKARRISPLDIVFNPLATSFKDSWKIVRSLRNIGELRIMAEDQPDNAYLKDALAQRDKLCNHKASYGIDNMDKDEGLMVDGFGNYSQYLESGLVEFLEFYGDLHDQDTGQVLRAHVCTVIDRMWVIRKEALPNWMGSAPIYHVGWRTRPDNLWAMGPLDNLVGMQYRIDHLENLKADAMDLAVLPPLKIKGEVEEFIYGPGKEIHIDENGDVEEMARNVQWVIQSDNAIQQLEQRMEMYAGAPREAMGIRTAGEKTAFEVQQLQNAAGRIFQEKATTFEIELLEKLLNAMLEVSARNLDKQDVVRVIDDDLGVQQFMTITKDDITASGKLRPIGARHFAAQAQLVQNLQGMSSSVLWQVVSPHLSGKKLAGLIEDVLGLQRFQLFSPNVAVFEQQETQRLANQAGEDLNVEQGMPPMPPVKDAAVMEQGLQMKQQAGQALRGM
jgi:hypothetical protein